MMWIAEYTCIILCDALWQMKFGRCCEIEKLIVAAEQRNPLPEPGDTHTCSNWDALGKGVVGMGEGLLVDEIGEEEEQQTRGAAFVCKLLSRLCGCV